MGVDSSNRCSQPWFLTYSINSINQDFSYILGSKNLLDKTICVFRLPNLLCLDMSLFCSSFFILLVSLLASSFLSAFLFLGSGPSEMFFLLIAIFFYDYSRASILWTGGPRPLNNINFMSSLLSYNNNI